MTSWADKILAFQKKLKFEIILPTGVHVMNPYGDEQANRVCKKFYETFYDDAIQRTMIVGINPGRMGGGITGIPFTDPVKLETLSIKNELPKKRELSADFIYEMIGAYGGAKKFYKKYYISAVSPLGFVRDGKNLNYYDVKGLPKLIDSFIVECLRQQLSWGLNPKICFCLGEGENFKFLKKLNETHRFFEQIVPLPHPRFIMQYRRKRINEFMELYVKKLATEWQ